MSQDNLHRFCVDTYNLQNFRILVDPKFKDPSYYSDKKPLCNNEYATLYSEIFLGRKENVQFNFSFSHAGWTESLIMNRSDIILNPHIFPDPNKEIDGSKIDVLGFIQDSRTYFISGYSASNSTKYSDLMESLSSFHTSLGFGLESLS